MARRKPKDVVIVPIVQDVDADGFPLYPRTPEGHIDNCALACGVAESDCQMCRNKCPDRAKFPFASPSALVDFPTPKPVTPSAGRLARKEAMEIDGPAPVRGVTQRELPSRTLFTIESNHPVWTGGSPDALVDEIPKASFVRIRPPHDAPDLILNRLQTLLAGRAARVVTLPRPKAAVIPAQVAASAERQRTTARQAVADLAAESNSKNLEALRALTEEIMSKEGL